MHIINARNVNDGLVEGMRTLMNFGQRNSSRAGDVVVVPQPVTTLFHRSQEMCCFLPGRNVNPFGTLFEGLWMLAGKNNVDWPARFIKRMTQFSDDGETLSGAYGERWRYRFGFDQLDTIVQTLQKNPNCRRQVLMMWDPETDLLKPTTGKVKDIPCNFAVTFTINPCDGHLDMSVMNRSNDIIWGTFGADAPHFGLLHDYMAQAIGTYPGMYYQISTNFHAYTEVLDKYSHIARLTPKEVEHCSRVYDSAFTRIPLFNGRNQKEDFDSDVRMFIEQGEKAIGYKTTFIKKVAVPMLEVHNAWVASNGSSDLQSVIDMTRNIRSHDWRFMCREWVQNSQAIRIAKEQAGDDNAA